MPDTTTTERIKVTGFRRPRMPRPPRRASHRVMPVRLMNLLWTVPLLIVPALMQGPGLPGLPRIPGLPDLSGPPHLLLFYTSTGEGVFKFYVECAYLGLDGGISHVSGSACPYVRFFKDRRS